MDSYQWMSAIFDNIAIPILAAFGGIIVFLIKSFSSKITDSIVAKNEAASLEKVFATKSYVVKQIADIVDAAVASNMQIADDMKRAGQKLTEEQIQQLQDSAKTLVRNSLPASITSEDGSMISIIGGQEQLDALISAMIEKSVYEYKIKKYKKIPDTVVVPEQANRTYTINPMDLYKRG